MSLIQNLVTVKIDILKLLYYDDDDNCGDDDDNTCIFCNLTKCAVVHIYDNTF